MQGSNCKTRKDTDTEIYKTLKTMTNTELLRSFGYSEATPHSVGGGDWSLEVRGEDGQLLFELVGSNGTNSPADDLWGELAELRAAAGV